VALDHGCVALVVKVGEHDIPEAQTATPNPRTREFGFVGSYFNLKGELQIRRRATVQICAKIHWNLDLILSKAAGDVLNHVAQEIVSPLFPGLSVDRPKVNQPRRENVTLAVPQVLREEVISAIEWLTSGVVAVCTQSRLELHQRAVGALNLLFTTLTHTNQRFGELPTKLAD
jgi:hypothetical protein